jgi:hypothetical protein
MVFPFCTFVSLVVNVFLVPLVVMVFCSVVRKGIESRTKENCQM